MILEVAIVLPVLMLFPLVITIIMYRNSYKIWNRDPDFNDRYSFLTDDVNVRKTWGAKFYWPVVITRRLLMIMYPIIFHNQNYFQL
jgi:hypothetical protein